MGTLWQDVRFGLHQLRKSPGFTVVAVVSLALGIGANTAIFNMINGILYKSLPVRNPHELRLINWTGQGGQGPFRIEGNIGRINSHKAYCGSFPYPAYRDFAKQARGFSDIFAFSYFEDPKTISAGGVASLANPQTVSGNFFKGYGAQVLIGRPIAPDDDRPVAPPVAVLTYPFWQRVYGLDLKVLGQTLTVLDTGFTIIVGVMPPEFVPPVYPTYRPDLLIPFEPVEAGAYRADRRYSVVGRLGANVTFRQAQAELNVISRQLAEKYPKENKGWRWVAKSLRYEYCGTAGHVLYLLLGASGLLLVVACANVADLLLVRGLQREREIAVRTALGAGRLRMLRQLAVEGLLLAAMGLVVGVFAVFAFTLSVVGLYGVMTHSTRSRFKEIAIRLATGAKPLDILRMILKQGAIIIAVGMGLGLVGVFALSRVAAGYVYGVAPLDPLTLVGAVFLLGIVSIFACSLPARRAAKIDPMEALRYE